jgi:hypothetical protein
MRRSSRACRASSADSYSSFSVFAAAMADGEGGRRAGMDREEKRIVPPVKRALYPVLGWTWPRSWLDLYMRKDLGLKTSWDLLCPFPGIFLLCEPN